MIKAGCLLDTGPIVALLDKKDKNHERVKSFFAKSSPPFITCESVLSEACFLMRKVAPDGAPEVLLLGQNGFYEIPIQLKENYLSARMFLKKYSNVPISLADACLICCAELYEEPRILTFDSDFEIYRWGRNKKFEIQSHLF